MHIIVDPQLFQEALLLIDRQLRPKLPYRVPNGVERIMPASARFLHATDFGTQGAAPPTDRRNFVRKKSGNWRIRIRHFRFCCRRVLGWAFNNVGSMC
ncbi:hypothetical protein BES08_30475 (plasmid) [Novosphingobium resinovorum]|uniref:Uncharacterized protein n=1 Tax=Novosphingobium resinovorum TaxID=158500 RepID=A0A1D8AGF0_9SPHN|nr:hypothetical protein BES08_30475 [Novosphingobium resinovorum]